MKYKTLFYLFGSLSLLLLAWNIYIFSTVSGIQNQLDNANTEKQAVKGFNEVLEYDLATSRDSVRLLKQQMSEPKE